MNFLMQNTQAFFDDIRLSILSTKGQPDSRSVPDAMIGDAPGRSRDR
jgi:hypothetical protein